MKLCRNHIITRSRLLFNSGIRFESKKNAPSGAIHGEPRRIAPRLFLRFRSDYPVFTVFVCLKNGAFTVFFVYDEVIRFLCFHPLSLLNKREPTGIFRFFFLFAMSDRPFRSFFL